MRESDFTTFEIPHFTQNEILATGANLEAIKLELIIRLQHFRSLMGRPVYLLKNGLTSGIHKSPYHPKGMASDIYLDPKDGEIKVLNVFKGALEAGFRGIGIYWNGSNYSFHFDLRPKFAFWSGVKTGSNEWDYHKLLQDPKDLLTKA